MKSLELNLQKRLLIVEGDIFEIPKYTQMWLNDKMKLICKGNELTEDIVSDLVHSTNLTKGGGEYYRDYGNIMGKELFFTALQSFISAIEKEGFYWLDNPMGKEPKITDKQYEKEYDFIQNNPEEHVYGDHYADWSLWKEAEAHTLRFPIIFEILE